MDINNQLVSNNFEFLSGQLSVSDIVRATLNSNSQQFKTSETFFSQSSKFDTKSVSSRTAPPKKSSRAIRRQNQDSLKDNPYAILIPEDLPPPGYTFDMPKFHFKPQHFEPSFVSFNLNSKNPKKIAPRLNVIQRKVLKKNSHVKEVLPKLETELRDFLAIFNTPSNYEISEIDESQNLSNKIDCPKEVDDSWDCMATEAFFGIKVDYELDLDAMLVSTPRVEPHPANPDIKVLICSMANSFHRYIMHVLCKYYNLISYSQDDPRGYRSVAICQPGISTNHNHGFVKANWFYPPKLMYEDLFF